MQSPTPGLGVEVYERQRKSPGAKKRQRSRTLGIQTEFIGLACVPEIQVLQFCSQETDWLQTCESCPAELSLLGTGHKNLSTGSVEEGPKLFQFLPCEPTPCADIESERIGGLDTGGTQ